MLPVTAEGGLDPMEAAKLVASLRYWPIAAGRAVLNAPEIIDHTVGVAESALSGDPYGAGQAAGLALGTIGGVKASRMMGGGGVGRMKADGMAAMNAAKNFRAPKPSAVPSMPASQMPAVMRQVGNPSPQPAMPPPSMAQPVPEQLRPPSGAPAHFNPEASGDIRGWMEGLGSDAGKANVLRALGLEPASAAPQPAAPAPALTPAPTPAPKAAPKKVPPAKPVTWDDIKDPADDIPVSPAPPPPSGPDPNLTAKLLEEGKRRGIVSGGAPKAAEADDLAALRAEFTANPELTQQLLKQVEALAAQEAPKTGAAAEIIKPSMEGAKGLGSPRLVKNPKKAAEPAPLDSRVKGGDAPQDPARAVLRKRTMDILKQGADNPRFKRAGVPAKLAKMMTDPATPLAELEAALKAAETVLTGKS